MLSKNERKYKLKSFTLMDVLAGMVIMSIVMVMVFGVINGVNKQSYDFQSMQLDLNNYKIMNAQLVREIDASDRIYELPEGFVVENQLGATQYHLKAGIFSRITEEGSEVLHPDVFDIKFEYFETLQEGNSLVSKITITSNYRETQLKSFFVKDYGLADPINFALLNVD